MEGSPGFQLSAAERDLLRETRRVAEETLEPIARAGVEGRVTRELVHALGANGLLGRLFPPEGGLPSALELCLLREGLAGACTDAENALALQGLGAYPIIRFGSSDLVSRYVTPVARGDAVAGFALTEPAAGTDAAAIELEAARDGVAFQTRDLFRPSVGAACVGMAQAALDAAIGYAAERRAFGRPIREFQAVSHRLAETVTRVDAARLLVYRAAGLLDAGERATKEAAMAKLYATETAQQAIDAAIQVHGAVALERGHLLERLYREVRATRIYEGTSEIQREIVARELFRKP